MKQLFKNFTKISNKRFIQYALGLVLSKEKSSCTKIAKIFGICHDSIYKILSKMGTLLNLFPVLMISVVKYFSKQKKGYLIIDDTAMVKPFSRKLPGVFDVFDTIFGRTERGFRKVVLAWSNGHATIPIKFSWIFHKDLVGKDYKTKSELARVLILFCLKHDIKFTHILFDAHYSTIELMQFLQKMRIKFVAKIPCNRKVTTKNGEFEQLKKLSCLKLFRNKRSNVIEAVYHGMGLYFSVHKRKNKNGEYSCVYIVSNICLHEKIYLKIYNQRWDIEKMFRTIKQLLGLNQCFSTKLERQEAHIYFVFFSYSFLENEKYKKNFINPETSARLLREAKLEDALSCITSFSENFQCSA